jgi:hypothetical protein
MNKDGHRDPVSEIAMSIATGLSFGDAEALVAVYSPQLSDKCRGIIRIPVLTAQQLLDWAPFTAQWVAEHDPKSDVVLLGVLIPPDRERPAARFYFADVPLGGLEVLRGHLEGLKDVRSVREFEFLVEADTFPERIHEYRKQYSTPRNDLLMQFFEERVKSTITERVHFLDKGGTCLLCDAPATQSVVSTTIATATGAETIAVTLCLEHERESEATFLLDYLAKELGFVSPLSITEADSESIYKIIKRALVELDCHNLRPDKEKVQMTGTRASGVNVILRCELHTEKRSYSYMVMTPSNVNIRRIDNARHHPEQAFRWDHQHLALPKNNSKVAPSFTTGLAILDLPTIRNEIEMAEKSLQPISKSP